MSYGVMRPGFNTPVGRVLFRICEDWIGVGECGDVFGGVFGGVIVQKYLTPFFIPFIEIQKKIICRDINICFILHIFHFLQFILYI